MAFARAGPRPHLHHLGLACVPSSPRSRNDCSHRRTPRAQQTHRQGRTRGTLPRLHRPRSDPRRSPRRHLVTRQRRKTSRAASLDAFAAVGPVYPGFDQGVVHHVLTHAQALLWLDELGYQALSASRRESQRRYLKLLRYRPSGPGAIDSTRTTLSDSRKPAFWDHDFATDPLPWLIGHIFKVPPAFHALADTANLSTSERRQRRTVPHRNTRHPPLSLQHDPLSLEALCAAS